MPGRRDICPGVTKQPGSFFSFFFSLTRLSHRLWSGQHKIIQGAKAGNGEISLMTGLYSFILAWATYCPVLKSNGQQTENGTWRQQCHSEEEVLFEIKQNEVLCLHTVTAKLNFVNMTLLEMNAQLWCRLLRPMQPVSCGFRIEVQSYCCNRKGKIFLYRPITEPGLVDQCIQSVDADVSAKHSELVTTDWRKIINILLHTLRNPGLLGK